MSANIAEPDLFAGVVGFGGASVRGFSSMADDIAFYTSEGFTSLLRDRFFFGRRGTTAAEADALVERITAKLARDWRVIGRAGLRSETRYSIRPHPDGQGWVHLPTPEAIVRLVQAEEKDPLFPDERLYGRLTVPVLIVQLTQGYDQPYAQRERDLAAANPLVTLRVLDTGEYPHYTRRDEVAEIILQAGGVTSGALISPRAEDAPQVERH